MYRKGDHHMKTITKPAISLLILTLIAFSGTTALATPQPSTHSIHDTITTPTPTLTPTTTGTSITLTTADTYTSTPGDPQLPTIHRTYEFPLGTTIASITAIPQVMITIPLIGLVTTTPRPLADPASQSPVVTLSPAYTMDQAYPLTWSSYYLTGGLNRQDQSTAFLTIELHPVRYNPIRQTLQYTTEFTLDINYLLPQSTPTLTNETTLVILTADNYKHLLTPLMNHKIACGISTKIVTIDDIKKGAYFPANGRDIAEQMKYFIKAAHENWGTCT